MGSTLDGNRLKQITVTGKGMTKDLVDSCIKASFSTSTSQVTELSLTFLDSMDLKLFRSKILASGATVNMGPWHMVSRVLSVASGSAGPELTVKAPSVYVERLRAQVGGYSWGDWDVAKWLRDMSTDVGLHPVVQGGLGRRTIVRAASEPGAESPESSWDVMVSVAKAAGCWLYEFGGTIVVAKPSWLMSQDWGGRDWEFGWNNWSDYSEGLAGMPAYSVDPNSNPAEKLTVRIISPDADECRPGDTVGLSGNVGNMSGRWLVVSVSYPMTVAGVVTAECVRPIDPVVPPEPAGAGPAGAAGAAGAKA